MIRFLSETWRLLKKDFRLVFRKTNRALFRGRFLILGFLAAVLLAAWFLVHPHDRDIYEHVRDNQELPLRRLADQLGHWGDFAQFNLLGFALFWITGALCRSRWFQRLAVVTFYSALLAGLTCNIFRFTTGRPRPYANLEDKFHGLPGVLKGWEYHGFPSGHTSTAMGMGTPVLTACGAWGLPVFAFGTSVGWARIYRQKHYPSDVLVGGAIGVIFGVTTGWHLGRVRRRRRKRKRSAAEPEEARAAT